LSVTQSELKMANYTLDTSILSGSDGAFGPVSPPSSSAYACTCAIPM